MSQFSLSDTFSRRTFLVETVQAYSHEALFDS